MSVRQSVGVIAILLLLLLPQWVSAARPAAPAQTPVGVDSIPPSVLTTASTAGETAFTLTTPVYTIETVENPFGRCVRVVVSTLEQAGGAGAPQLPLKSLLLGVPPAAQLSVEVTPLSRQEISLASPLCPGPERVTEEGENGVLSSVEQAVAPDAASYSFNGSVPEQIAQVQALGFMRSQRLARVQVSPFQYNPATRILTYYAQLQVRVVHPSADLSAASLQSVAEPGVFESGLQATMLNYDAARTFRQAAIEASATSRWVPPTPAYQVTVEDEGLYAISYEDLASAGLPVGTIPASKYRMFLDGEEIALRLVSATGQDKTDDQFVSGDRILFYGQSSKDKYSGVNVYWLTYGSTSGIRMVTKFNQSNYEAPLVTSYVASTVVEENTSYVSAAPKLPDYEHWYGRQLSVFGANAAASQSYIIEVSNLSSAETASISLSLAVRTRGDHHLRIYVNESLVHEALWNGAIYQITTGEFPQKTLVAGRNVVRLEIVNDQPFQTISVAYVDKLQVNYQRQLLAVKDHLIFDGPSGGALRFTVKGLLSSNVELYDITNRTRPGRINAGASGGQLSFGTLESEPRHYLIDSPTSWRSVLSIAQVSPLNLLASSNGADYLIISHPDFLQAIQPLADYRAGQGYRVKVVNVQDIYDLFGYGRQSAVAIRDFLAYTYSHWAGPAPSYVLLVGDGTYDPRGYAQNSKPTFIPPYLEMVDSDLGETAADNRYVAIAGDDIVPDMHLGRFPVNSPEETTAMVNKTLAYALAPVNTGWNRNVLFVTDDLESGGGGFYNFSDAIADDSVEFRGRDIPVLPAEYTKIKAYLGRDCDASGCKKRIVDALNSGVLLVSYVGHGAKNTWASENLMDIATLSQLNNQNVLPVMLPMTCLEGYYQQADADTLAESLVRLPNRGAVASWSATGLGLVTGHDYLEKGFFLAAFHDNILEIGAAATAGKLYLAANAPPGKYDDLLDTFVLFGDPALQLRVATGQGNSFNLYLPSVSH